MDLSMFATELQKAGLDTPSEKTNRFADVSEFVLPYVGEHSTFYDINQKLLKDANYIDSTKRPLTKDEFVKKVKIINDPIGKIIYKWVLEHLDHIFVVNKGNIRKKACSFAETKDFDEKYEKDTEYGFVCLGFLIDYSKQHMTLYIDNVHNERTIDSVLNNPNVSIYDYDDIKKVELLLNTLLEKSEYIPICLNEDASGVRMNFSSDHKDSRISSYGENILKDKDVMNRLKEDGFFDNGTKINPNAWYFYMCNMSCTYLKRDLTKSPRKPTT